MFISREQVLRLAVSLLIVLLFILIAGIIAYSYGPLAGYRSYQGLTRFEISDFTIAENRVLATISNNELNTVTLTVWLEISDEASNEIIYRSEQERLEPLAPQQKQDVQFVIPETYLSVAGEDTIEVKVSEFIAYVDSRPGSFEQNLLSAPEEEPVRINQVDIDAIDSELYHLGFDITIDNDTNLQQDYRYSFTINRINDSSNRSLLDNTVFSSEFFFAIVDARESATFLPEIELILEPGDYGVSLWLQKLEDNRYVHYWQTTFPQPIEISSD